MEKKLIIFDMDGTLLDHKHHRIPLSTQQTIAALQAQGHVCAIATGRSPGLLYGYDKLLKIDHLVASNGRFVHSEGTTIYAHTMEADMVRRFRQAMDEAEIDFAYQTADVFVSHGFRFKHHILFSEYFNEEIPTVDPEFNDLDSVLQIIIFDQKEIPESLKQDFPELTFLRSCPYGLDVNLVGGMKEIGIGKLAQKVNISAQDTIVVGDGLNDISMFHYAGFSIAMGNAPDAVKKEADRVTASVDKDGIYKAFKDLGYLEGVTIE